MAKYSQKLVDRICSLIREDSYTIAEICDLVGINKDTYYTWMKTKSDFSDSVKKRRMHGCNSLLPRPKSLY